MSKQVLVLNAGYEPLSLVSVRRAVVLLLHEKAEMLEATQQMLTSTSRSIPIPLVIRLVHYVKLPHRRVPATRASIMLRDAYICQYCGEAPGHSHLTVDHVVPRSRGGVHDWHNLVTACKRCNQKKGSLTPDEADPRIGRHDRGAIEPEPHPSHSRPAPDLHRPGRSGRDRRGLSRLMAPIAVAARSTFGMTQHPAD